MLSEFISLKIKIIIISISVVIVLLTACADILIFNNDSNVKNNNNDEENIEISENIKTVGKLILPLEDFITITANFGLYDPYNSGKYTNHTGIDLVGKKNCKILSVEDGEVVISNYMKNGYGNYVKIKHSINGEIIYTLYGHMKETPFVQEGNLVKKGQVIGIQGSTGNSTGDHLHFEIIKKESKIDPYPYIFK